MSLLSLKQLEGYLHFDEAECRQAGRQLADAYQNAMPFPHIVIDDFLDADLLRRVAAKYPDTEGKKYFDRDQERLKFQFHASEVPSGLTRNLLAELNGRAFLGFLEEMTGIRGLIADYKITPLDQLKVSVFQVADLSGNFDVDLNGEVAFPLIGLVKVADLTTRELQGQLKERLRKYVHDPVVSIAVNPSVKRSVTVDGSVRQPGMFPVAGSMTLIQAIALAHGLDDAANPRRIVIFRRIGGQRMAAAFDLENIRRGKEDDPEIHSGDVIVVDGSKTKAIQREILQTLPVLGLFRPF